MGSRMVLAMVAAIAIVAVGGIGFAAFTTTATVSGNGSAGSVQLTWTAGAATFCSESVNTYTDVVSTGYVYYPGDTLILSAGNLAPGDYCTFSATINNVGSLPVTVTGAAPTGFSGAACSAIYYGDSISGGGGAGSPFGTYSTSSPTVAAYGGTTSFTASIGLGSGAGNSYEGTGCSFTVTLTGST